jgi:hypothetical protein
MRQDRLASIKWSSRTMPQEPKIAGTFVEARVSRAGQFLADINSVASSSWDAIQRVDSSFAGALDLELCQLAFHWPLLFHGSHGFRCGYQSLARIGRGTSRDPRRHARRR